MHSFGTCLKYSRPPGTIPFLVTTAYAWQFRVFLCAVDAKLLYATSICLDCSGAETAITGAETHMRPAALVRTRRSQNRLFKSGIKK